MNKLFFGSFATLLAAGAFAQTAPPTPTHTKVLIAYEPGVYSWRDSSIPTYLAGDWARENTASENWLLDSGGTTTVLRDQNVVTDMDLTLNTENNPGQRSGRISQVHHQSSSANTTIHSTDDSSLTGATTGLPTWPWFGNKPANAITVSGAHPLWTGFKSGNWIIDEGNYIGGGLSTPYRADMRWIASGQAGLGGAVFDRTSSLTSIGASFYGVSASGSQTDAQFNRGGTGLYVIGKKDPAIFTDISLTGTDGKNESTGGNSGSISFESANDVFTGQYNGMYGTGLYADGGAGAVLATVGTVSISDYDFTGGGNATPQNIRSITVDGIDAQNNDFNRKYFNKQ